MSNQSNYPFVTRAYTKRVCGVIVAACVGFAAIGASLGAAQETRAPKHPQKVAVTEPFAIQLQTRRFTPTAMSGAAIVKRIEGAVQARSDASGVRAASAYLHLQFKNPVSTKRLEFLAKAGVDVVGKLSERSFIALVNPKRARHVLRGIGLRWAGIIPAADKLSPQIKNIEKFAWTTRAGGRRAYTLVFHKGVTAKEVAALIKRHRLIAEDFDRRTFAVVRVVTMSMTASQLQAVAQSNIVVWIQPYGGPDTDNNFVTSQPMSNVDDVQIAPYNLSGTGITAGSWEAGDVVRATHVDLTPRVTVAAGQTASMDDHAAHTAGTIGASGVNFPNAEGMAPQVSIVSYDSTNDTNEMAAASAAAAVPRVQLSNHSYSKGSNKGWNSAGNTFNNTQNLFGSYDANALAFDNVVIANDQIVFINTGNDRQDNWDGVTLVDIDGDGVNDPTPPNDCQQSGFAVDADCISAIGSAKNVITVGAMNAALAGRLYSGSGFGPTDDGRLKPNLMAHGNNVFSLGATTDNDTSTKSGTSMAAPVVTGVAALVLEEAAGLSLTITAAGMKALLIQTAQDVQAATDPGGLVLHAALGPDYATGWGIVDAQAAVDLLRRVGGPGLIQDQLTGQGDANAETYAFYVPAGLAEMHSTLAWTDPAGNAALAANVPQLVNDLKLRLIEPDGLTVHTPWLLDPTNPQTAAVRNGGDDVLNTVEQVSVANPVTGMWTAKVSTDSALTNGPQAFALAGPLTAQRSDIVLVLDRSGSMTLSAGGGSPLTKRQALQNAANQFIDFIEMAAGHQLGLVQYEEIVVPFAPAFDLQPLDSGNVGAAHTAVDGIVAGGWTNIIGGITTGVGQMAAAVNPQQVVVLFSDGIHNRPVGSDLNDIDAIIPADTRFYSIGFGDDIDDAILSVVAANKNGAHYNEIDLPLGLSKLFMTVAGLSVNEQIAIDPDYQLQKGERAKLGLVATPRDRAITFSINWETPNKNQVSATLIAPGRGCRVPLKDHRGLKTRSGSTYRLIRVELPYRCANGELRGPGMWRLAWQANEADNSDKLEAVKVMALVDSTLALDSTVKTKGNEVLLAVHMGTPQSKALPLARAVAILQRSPPPSGMGTTQDKLGKDFRQRNEMPRPADKPIEVRLYDDGTHGDKRKGDGVFMHRLSLEKLGLYSVRIIAEAKQKEGLVRRESLLSFHTGDK